MRDALSHMYPSDRSGLYHMVGPLLDPWTYARALHLLVMFPLGIAYFVVLVTALSIGLALSWTLVGPPLLLLTMYLTRWAGDGEAWAARHLYGIALRRPPTTIERGSYRSQVWARLIDPTTWTGLVYLFVQFPVGIATFVFLVTTTAVSLSLIAVPFALAFGSDGAIHVGDAGWAIDEPLEAWWLPLVGLATLLLEVHGVNLLSALHAWWARLMLGSRAPHIVPGAPLGDLPPGPGGAPEAPLEVLDGPLAPEAATAAAVTPDAAPPIAPFRSAPSVTSAARPFEVNDPVLASLTPREREVLHLIARGYSNAEIAEAFVVSEGTVKTHVKRVLAKLELRDRTQAAVWAFDHGFVRPALHLAVVAGDAEMREPLQLRVPR